MGENNKYNIYNKLQLFTLRVLQSCCKGNNKIQHGFHEWNLRGDKSC